MNWHRFKWLFLTIVPILLWNQSFYFTVTKFKLQMLIPDDFRHFYLSAIILKSGLPILYDESSFQQYAHQVGLIPVVGGGRTAPAALALLLPLTSLDLFAAQKVMLFLNHLMVVGAIGFAIASLKYVRKDGEGPGLAVYLLLISSILSSIPNLENFLQGQLNGLVLFSVSASLWSWLSGRSVWAGFWLWPAISAKLFPAIWAAFYLLKGDRKAFLSTLGFTLLFNFLAGASFGLHNLWAYPTALLHAVTAGGATDFGNQSLRNGLGHLFNFGNRALPDALWVLASVSAVIVTTWLTKRSQSNRIEVQLLLVCLTQFLISSYSTSAQHLSLAYPVFLVLCQGDLPKHPWFYPVICVATACAFLSDGYVAYSPLTGYVQNLLCNCYLAVVSHCVIYAVSARLLWLEIKAKQAVAE